MRACSSGSHITQGLQNPLQKNAPFVMLPGNIQLIEQLSLSLKFLLPSQTATMLKES